MRSLGVAFGMTGNRRGVLGMTIAGRSPAGAAGRYDRSVLAALVRRVGGWIGRLFGRPAADEDTLHGMDRSDNGVRDDRDPIQPEAVAGTDDGLQGAIRRSLVPRWLAALRTQVFTGLAALGLVLFGGLTALVTGG